MPNSSWSTPSRRHLPIILIRGFGGLDVEDEKAIAYQGFNDGSVYPQKRGENYIYEGLILRLLKHRRQYYDATNVVGYFANPVTKLQPIPSDLTELDANFFTGHKVVIDAGMALAPPAVGGRSVLHRVGVPLLRPERPHLRGLRRGAGPSDPVHPGAAASQAARRSRAPQQPAQGQHRRALHGRSDRARCDPAGLSPAHRTHRCRGSGDQQDRDARHAAQGHQLPADPGAALARDRGRGRARAFQPGRTGESSATRPPGSTSTSTSRSNACSPWSAPIIRSYGVRASTWANRLFAVGGEYGPNYNRSDGLVKQAYAQIDGAPRTFVHKCHGGFNSLVTSRETYEITTRFFSGNVRARLRLIEGKITRGFDWIGKSEFFFGVSIKPRRVDFELFHQSKEAENCYGPFHTEDLSDGDPAFAWADDRRLIWEGYLDVDLQAAARSGPAHRLLRRRARPVRHRVLGQRGLLQTVLRARDLQGRSRAVPATPARSSPTRRPTNRSSRRCPTKMAAGASRSMGPASKARCRSSSTGCPRTATRSLWSQVGLPRKSYQYERAGG